MIDLSFRINWQARAVLVALPTALACAGFDRNDPDLRVDVNAWPFYNGREMGVCLEVRDRKRGPYVNSGERLLVSFSEIRNSDGIFVQTARAKSRMNGPTLEDFSEESYRARRSFDEGDIYKAAQHIASEIRSYCDERE